MDYYNKYLKYKNKYSSLKILIGGFNRNVILCCSHNNRLECFFRSIEKDYPKKAFNNCVIIKYYNNKFEMIYVGEKYESSTHNKECWDIESFNNFFSNRTYNFDLPNNTEVLLIRHALGVHNKMSLLEKIFNFKKDSQLDTDGIFQAQRAGEFLKQYLTGVSNLLFMASSLIRTQQTIAVIMITLNKKQDILVVTCNHELNYVSNGVCDSHFIQKIPILSNIPRCKDSNNSCDKLTNFSGVVKYKDYNISINWNHYINKNCQDTNILLEILEIIKKI